MKYSVEKYRNLIELNLVNLEIKKTYFSYDSYKNNIKKRINFVDTLDLNQQALRIVCKIMHFFCVRYPNVYILR